MTSINRNWLLVLLCLLTLIFTAAGLGGIVVAAAGTTGADASYSLKLLPVVVALELMVYFVAAMVSNPRATIAMAAGSAVVLAVVRAICSAIGGMLYFILADNASASGVLAVWGNPVVALAQAAIIVLAGAYVLAMAMPDLVGQPLAMQLLGIGQKPKDAPRTSLDANPAGGFIQVFSFEELAAVLKKSHGIEGFMLVSSEGLIVWRDLPLRVDVDSLSAKVFGHCQAIGALVEDSGLTKVRRLMVESREHFLFATTLDQNFSLILLFNGRVAPEEILSRIAVLTKSCREFLQWKYPSLPLRAGLSKSASLETA